MKRIGVFAAAALALSVPGAAWAGTDLYIVNYGSGTIGEYNADTGAAINTALVSGLSSPEGLAVSGSDLFVANFNAGAVGEYSAVTGTAISASLISGQLGPYDAAVSGSDLFFTNVGSNTIGEYNLSSGVDSSFISGLDQPAFLTVANSGSAVPEPASLSLLAAGALGLATLRRRARR